MGAQSVPGFYRLFMAPGVDHCRGGAGPDRFDALGAVMAWREHGQAPERLIASAANGARTRPLCPYPQVARYSGAGSTDDAASFQCIAQGR
jgi:feruloyl esterase